MPVNNHDSKNGPATPYTARAESLNYYPMFGGLGTVRTTVDPILV
jgi:hypothetical protein